MLSLREFTERLEPKSYGSVDRYYEVTRILLNSEGLRRPAQFQVKETEVRSVGAVISDRRHLRMALGVDSDEEAYRRILNSMKGGRVHVEGTPPLKEVDVDLLRLPAVKFYKLDGGLYFTSSVVVACQDDICNASIHRIMVLDKSSAVIRLVPRHLWRMYRESIERGSPLKVSIVFGVHPIFLISAATSPPLGVFELTMPSTILGREISLVESPVSKVPVPWPFSVLLEAEITGELVPEGPFVDVTKTYDKVRRQPVVKVKRMYINEEEPFHIILPGGNEHMLLMGYPREAAIWDSVSKVVPRVYSVRLTPGGGMWLHAVIAIEKNHDGDAKNAILAAFSAHPSLKHVIIVDKDINVDDPEDIEWAIATRFQGDKDLIIISNVRGSTLDPSSDNAMTTKVGIDATAPLAEKERFLKVEPP